MRTKSTALLLLILAVSSALEPVIPSDVDNLELRQLSKRGILQRIADSARSLRDAASSVLDRSWAGISTAVKDLVDWARGIPPQREPPNTPDRPIVYRPAVFEPTQHVTKSSSTSTRLPPSHPSTRTLRPTAPSDGMRPTIRTSLTPLTSPQTSFKTEQGPPSTVTPTTDMPTSEPQQGTVAPTTISPATTRPNKLRTTALETDRETTPSDATTKTAPQTDTAAGNSISTITSESNWSRTTILHSASERTATSEIATATLQYGTTPGTDLARTDTITTSPSQGSTTVNVYTAPTTVLLSSGITASGPDYTSAFSSEEPSGSSSVAAASESTSTATATVGPATPEQPTVPTTEEGKVDSTTVNKKTPTRPAAPSGADGPLVHDADPSNNDIEETPKPSVPRKEKGYGFVSDSR